MKKRLAVFDVDGTIFRSSLVIELVNELIKSDIFPKKVEKEIEKDYVAWLNREGHYDRYLEKVVKVYEKNIAGCLEVEVEEVIKKVLESEKKKVYRYARYLIRYLKEKNYFLFAISGSPGHILTTFAKEIGFDKYLGGYYEVQNRKFTGNQPYGNPARNKEKTLKEFLDKSEVKFDLKDSIGIGDTQGDIPFLKMLGNPIAFNPNRELAEYADKNNWKIIVERKDVIYDLRSFKLIKI